MNTRHYPLHTSLCNSLRTVDAPLLSLRLIRILQSELMIDINEVEILLGLATKSGSFAFIDICDMVKHLSKDRIKRCLQSLHNLGLIERVSADCDHGFRYLIKPMAAQRIMCVDKDSLN